MGAWGELAFDNDTACDWAYDLEGVNDLSLVEAAFKELEADPEYVDSDVACNALAACEVIARLLGRPSYHNGYTEGVDKWVKAHKLKPPAALVKRAAAAIDRILGEDSELRELWEDGADDGKWRAAVADLSKRVSVT